MKDEVRVSLVQFAPAWLDRDANAERMSAFADREARDHGAELIVFPELANIGYIGTEQQCDLQGVFDIEFARKYMAAAEPVPGPTTRALGEVAARHKTHIVVGMAQLHPVISGVLYNSAVLIGPDGGVVGVQHKVHLPFAEKHYFALGSKTEVFDTPLAKIGMLICYDGRFPESARVLTLKGAEIVCAIWARRCLPKYSTPEHNRAVSLVRAEENAIYYLHCNRSGRENNNEFMGHSAIGAPNGEVVAFSETKGEDVLRAVLKREVLMDARMFLPMFRDRRPDVYSEIVQPL